MALLERRVEEQKEMRGAEPVRGVRREEGTQWQ
jgi:hypothetical protein